MKNITKLLVLIAIVAMTAFGTTAHAQKIAYVDSDQIVPEMPAYKRAKSEVEAYGKQLQKILQGKQAAMQTYYQEVSDSVQRGLMTPLQQKQAEAKLQQMQIDLQQEAAEADQKLAKKEAELTKPLYEEFNTAIAKMAKENGYAYVMEKKFMLYSAGGIDATEKLKTALGLSW